MADKLLIILMNIDPKHSTEVTTPLFQAVVAASLEYQVEIVLTGGAGELARQGFAVQFYLQEGKTRSVYDLIKEAHEVGVKFKLCTPTLGEWGSDLIPEIDDIVSSTYVISEAMTDGTVTFTY